MWHCIGRAREKERALRRDRERERDRDRDRHRDHDRRHRDAPRVSPTAEVHDESFIPPLFGSRAKGYA